MRRHRICRYCRKRRYATQEAAQAEIARLSGFSARPVTPVRAYQADCGWWHLTSSAVPWWEAAVEEVE